MHFGKTTPKEIYTWIQKKENGNRTDYDNVKKDTQEAIGVFRNLYSQTFGNVEELSKHLETALRLRSSLNDSLYRSFIVLSNDMIITLRLSEHYSTKRSTSQSAERNDKPNVEYHLVIGAKRPNNPKKYIRKDRPFNDIEVKVRDINLEDFNDAQTRQRIINEIVCLLSYGTTYEPTNVSVDAEGNHVPANGDGADYVSESYAMNRFQQFLNECVREALIENELRHHINKINHEVKTPIRITESRLRKIVCKSLSSILQERWEQREGQSMKEREMPPTITLKAYKQVQLNPLSKESGMVYPLYVDSTSGWKIGQWYDAGIGEQMVEIDDETNEPTGKVKVNSKLGGLSFRPGLHFGSVPYAPHIYTRKDNFSEEKDPSNLDIKGRLRKDYDYSKTRLQKKNVVWAECEISFDKDYNEEAKENGTYVNSKGKRVFNPSNAYLKHLPTDGAYEFRTNTNAPKWATWYIAGAFKINRLLTDEEVKRLCAEHDVVSLDRDGILDLTQYPSLSAQ